MQEPPLSVIAHYHQSINQTAKNSGDKVNAKSALKKRKSAKADAADDPVNSLRDSRSQVAKASSKTLESSTAAIVEREMIIAELLDSQLKKSHTKTAGAKAGPRTTRQVLNDEIIINELLSGTKVNKRKKSVLNGPSPNIKTDALALNDSSKNIKKSTNRTLSLSKDRLIQESRTPSQSKSDKKNKRPQLQTDGKKLSSDRPNSSLPAIPTPLDGNQSNPRRKMSQVSSDIDVRHFELVDRLLAERPSARKVKSVKAGPSTSATEQLATEIVERYFQSIPTTEESAKEQKKVESKATKSSAPVSQDRVNPVTSSEPRTKPKRKRSPSNRKPVKLRKVHSVSDSAKTDEELSLIDLISAYVKQFPDE